MSIKIQFNSFIKFLNNNRKNISILFLLFISYYSAYLFFTNKLNWIITINLAGIIFYLLKFFPNFPLKKSSVFYSIYLPIIIVDLSLFKITNLNFYLIFLGVYSLLILNEYLYKKKNYKYEDEQPLPLFEARKPKLIELKNKIFDQNIPSIVINQKIGSGKTIFVKNLIFDLEHLEMNQLPVEVIYIKLPFLNDIKELQTVLLEELKKIFSKNKLNYFFLDNILKYISGVKTSNFEILLTKKNDTFWNNLFQLKQNLNKLMKSKHILVIIDDIERCPDQEFRKNSIFFLGEFAEFFRETRATMLFLVDLKSITNDFYKSDIHFDKYFSYELELPEINISNFEESDFSLLYTNKSSDDLFRYVNYFFRLWKKFHLEILVDNLDKYNNIEVTDETKEKIKLLQEFVLKKNNIRTIQKFINELSSLDLNTNIPLIDRLILISPIFLKNFYSINVGSLNLKKIIELDLKNLNFISKEYILYFYINNFSKENKIFSNQDEVLFKIKQIILNKSYHSKFLLSPTSLILQYICDKTSSLNNNNNNLKKIDWTALFNNINTNFQLNRILKINFFFNNTYLNLLFFEKLNNLLESIDLEKETLEILMKFLSNKYNSNQHYFLHFRYPVCEEEDEEQSLTLSTRATRFAELHLLLKRQLNKNLINEYSSYLEDLRKFSSNMNLYWEFYDQDYYDYNNYNDDFDS